VAHYIIKTGDTSTTCVCGSYIPRFSSHECIDAMKLSEYQQGKLRRQQMEGSEAHDYKNRLDSMVGRLAARYTLEHERPPVLSLVEVAEGLLEQIDEFVDKKFGKTT